MVRNNQVNDYPEDLTTEVRTLACEPASRPRPAFLDDRRVVVVTIPAPFASCAHGGRTELHLDDSDRVVAVDVAVSQP